MQTDSSDEDGAIEDEELESESGDDWEEMSNQEDQHDQDDQEEQNDVDVRTTNPDSDDEESMSS